MEDKSRPKKAKRKNSEPEGEKPAKKHQMAMASDATSGDMPAPTQENSVVRANQEPIQPTPLTMKRKTPIPSTVQHHHGAGSPGSPDLTPSRSTSSLFAGPVRAPDSSCDSHEPEHVSEFSGPGTAPYADTSIGLYSESADGDLEFSWTLRHSSATISLAPDSKVWSRLHPSCVLTSPPRPDVTPRAPPLPLPLTGPSAGASAEKQEHFRFLDLPKDVRFMVYDHLTRETFHPVADSKMGLWYKDSPSPLGLFLTCRFIYDETGALVRTRRWTGGLTLLTSVRSAGDWSLSDDVAEMVKHGVTYEEVEKTRVKGVMGGWARALVIEPFVRDVGLQYEELVEKEERAERLARREAEREAWHGLPVASSRGRSCRNKSRKWMAKAAGDARRALKRCGTPSANLVTSGC
ncbi:hypothetical protein K458DRAFT_409534 [Lentithecium fluviatile CBS 122367]|uniref:Uncharacterized protein n=1 Tax=Lentithecium fluviatile CBS 122367 TaxID=1168545 RepID=A0A6G1II87_9PLEO|nr:hypothetical protein K458DRAFT_409534 [Lentithecium fluviatile CBS 122367]